MKKQPCAAVCPISKVCGEQQKIYDAHYDATFGAGEESGILGVVMSAGADAERILGEHLGIVGPELERAKDAVAAMIGLLDDFKPREHDFAAMEAGCADGPVENRAGLPLGFDATLRCGSLAIDEETRRYYTTITERAAEPPVAG